MYRWIARRCIVSAVLITPLVVGGCSRDVPVAPQRGQANVQSAVPSGASTVSGGILTMRVGESQVLAQPTGISRSRTFSWHSNNSGVAMVNASGVVRAVRVGSATITASGAGLSQQYLMNVEDVAAKVTGLVLTPSVGTMVPFGGTLQFRAILQWSDGVERALPTNYLLPLGGGSISQDGLFTASSIAGTFLVVANCVCGFSDTARVEVREPVQLQKLTINPRSLDLTPGAANQFSVAATWSTGATSLPPLTWTATGGSISQTGAYIAPNTPGTYRVVVGHTGGQARDTSIVTVKADQPAIPSPLLWEVVRNFNSGGAGKKAEKTPDGFDDAAGYSVYSNERSAEGGMSARLSIDAGSEGWGWWGGVITFPTRLAKDADLWLQLYVFMPEDFVIKTPGNGSLKFIRIATKNLAGNNAGYIDIQLQDDGTTTSSMRMIKEQQDRWFLFGNAGSFKRGVWQRVSVNFTLSAVPAADGGNARVRVWHNGGLITDEPRVKTLTSSTDVATMLYLFTYWNGRAPRTQSLWVDDIRIAAGRPSWAEDLR